MMGWLDRMMGRASPPFVEQGKGGAGAMPPKTAKPAKPGSGKAGVPHPNVKALPGAAAAAPAPSLPPDTKLWAGIPFHKDELFGQEDMVKMGKIQFIKTVSKELDINPLLNSRVCLLVMNESGKDLQILVDKASSSVDEVSEVVRQVNNRGCKIVQGYFASQHLIISLSKGHLTGQMLKAQREVRGDKSKSAYFEAFRDIVGWGYDNNADDIDWLYDETNSHNQVAFLIGGRYIKPAQFTIAREALKGMLHIAWQWAGTKSGHSFDPLIEQQTSIPLELPPAQPHRPNGAKVKLRWSGLPNDKGVAVTMRIQRQGENTKVKSLEAAGYLPGQISVLKRVIHSEGGIICFSGVVGSGKSTTLAQLIRMLPQHLKIQSIEDPVEIEMPGVLQKTIARDLSQKDSSAFLSASRALFRSALHALLLGEIRDTETGGLARQIAESGHSVYTTTHARSALGVIDRFASPNIGIPRDVLGAPDIIKLLVYQSLLAVNCPECSLSPEDHILQNELQNENKDNFLRYIDRIERVYKFDSSQVRFQNHEGCPSCRRDGIAELNGLSGRTVVCEMVEGSERLSDLILTGSSMDLMRFWRSQSDGRFDSSNMTGKTAMENAVYKMSLGQIDPFEVERRFSSFETIENKLNSLQ